MAHSHVLSDLILLSLLCTPVYTSNMTSMPRWSADKRMHGSFLVREEGQSYGVEIAPEAGLAPGEFLCTTGLQYNTAGNRMNCVCEGETRMFNLGHDKTQTSLFEKNDGTMECKNTKFTNGPADNGDAQYCTCKVAGLDKTVVQWHQVDSNHVWQCLEGNNCVVLEKRTNEAYWAGAKRYCETLSEPGELCSINDICPGIPSTGELIDGNIVRSLNGQEADRVNLGVNVSPEKISEPGAKIFTVISVEQYAAHGVDNGFVHLGRCQDNDLGSGKQLVEEFHFQWHGTVDICCKSNTLSGHGHGDPHLMNMKGEEFDVMQEGNMLLLETPRGSTRDTLNLGLWADIDRLGAVNCGPTYITAIQLDGSWLGKGPFGNGVQISSGRVFEQPFELESEKHAFGIRFGDDPYFSHVTFASQYQGLAELPGGATIAVRDRTFLVKVKSLTILVTQPKRPRVFLDVQVKGLETITGDVGGLLGIDEHASAEELPFECMTIRKPPRRRRR